MWGSVLMRGFIGRGSSREVGGARMELCVGGALCGAPRGQGFARDSARVKLRAERGTRCAVRRRKVRPQCI